MANGSEGMKEKRDILEYPIEDLDVPSAIRLMMQAANKTGHQQAKAQSETELNEGDERLALLAEKLEARIEDELEKVKVPVEVLEEPEEEIYQSAVEDEVVKVMADGDIYQVVVGGTVFGKLCNEPVAASADGYDSPLPCIKQWGHEFEHVDMKGAYR